jgi:cobalt/nickel transport system ATP-binding protein
VTALDLALSDVRVWREDGLGGPPNEVVHGVTATLGAGRRLALIGANGAGKTSLLLALVGAVRFSGRISVGEVELDRRSLREIRRRVGFVFAEPTDQLFLPTALDEAALAPRQRGLPDAEARARATLHRVGLAHAAARPPSSLSLGEQRRLALATVLSAEPGVLLLDEPTASLDGRSRRAVLTALAGTEATTVFATHDLEAALALDADVLVLAGGKPLGSGPARDVLSNAELLDRAALDVPPSLAGPGHGALV